MSNYEIMPNILFDISVKKFYMNIASKLNSKTKYKIGNCINDIQIRVPLYIARILGIL